MFCQLTEKGTYILLYHFEIKKILCEILLVTLQSFFR